MPITRFQIGPHRRYISSQMHANIPMRGNGKLWNRIKRAAKKVHKFAKKAVNNPVMKKVGDFYVHNVAPVAKAAVGTVVGQNTVEMAESAGKEFVKNPNMKGLKNAGKAAVNTGIQSTGLGKTALGQQAGKQLNDLLFSGIQKGSGATDMLKDEI